MVREIMKDEVFLAEASEKATLSGTRAAGCAASGACTGRTGSSCRRTT